MSLRMNVTGIEEVKKYLDKIKGDVHKKNSEGLIKASIFVQGEVKQSIAGHRAEHVSVKTGRFLNSIEFRAKNDEAVVYTDVPYGPFLEYGTTRFAPRMHFRNSAARCKQKVKELLSASIKSI